MPAPSLSESSGTAAGPIVVQADHRDIRALRLWADRIEAEAREGVAA